MAVTSIKPGGAGPLTTVFTTPDFCAASAWNDVGTPPLSSSICMPPDGWTEYWNSRAGFFSPAICPKGYTRGCTIPTDLATGMSLGGPLTASAGETGHICCPTGYTCFPGDSLTEPWPYSKCQATAPTTYETSNEATSVFLTTTSQLVYAIQVRWRESDLPQLETNPTVYGQIMTATATASAASRSTAAATATSTNPADGGDDGGGGGGDSGDGGRLSTGAQIGIIVGAVAGVIALAVGAYLLWRRREDRKRHRLLSQTAPEEEMKPGSNSSYRHISEDHQHQHLAVPHADTAGNSPVSPLSPAAGPPPSTAATEMHGSTAFAAELPGSQVFPVEAPAGNAVIAELPGDHAVFEKDTGTGGKA
ncbi:cg16707-like protein [Diplodia corticola]|uniref:Cg16707-like protein n=1 Tax=Diplodia corticola TaxID=236234 RepID=A0A1J9RQN3_9PEZI|nr:cg16707-like protein [Diplodia corticola]OJD29861.1 cg16707-like protein [Diplodia corticola]